MRPQLSFSLICYWGAINCAPFSCKLDSVSIGSLLCGISAQTRWTPHDYEVRLIVMSASCTCASAI